LRHRRGARAGDVIPEVVGRVEGPGRRGPRFVMPARCPDCRTRAMAMVANSTIQTRSPSPHGSFRSSGSARMPSSTALRSTRRATRARGDGMVDSGSDGSAVTTFMRLRQPSRSPGLNVGDAWSLAVVMQRTLQCKAAARKVRNSARGTTPLPGTLPPRRRQSPYACVGSAAFTGFFPITRTARSSSSV